MDKMNDGSSFINSRLSGNKIEIDADGFKFQIIFDEIIYRLFADKLFEVTRFQNDK